jgi:hypothetical protein
MGCQREIADRTVSREEHYLSVLKEHQGSLYGDALCGFKLNRFPGMEASREYDRGRCETRKCSIIEAGTALLEETRERRPHLKTIVRVEATRLQTVNNQKKHVIASVIGMVAMPLVITLWSEVTGVLKIISPGILMLLLAKISPGHGEGMLRKICPRSGNRLYR